MPLPSERNRHYRCFVSQAFDIVRAGYDDIGVKYRDGSAPYPVSRPRGHPLLAEPAPPTLVGEPGCRPGARGWRGGGWGLPGVVRRVVVVRWRAGGARSGWRGETGAQVAS